MNLFLNIGERNINNLCYADTTLIAKNSKNLKPSLVLKVKEQSGKMGIKLNVKNKLMTIGRRLSHRFDNESIEIWIVSAF